MIFICNKYDKSTSNNSYDHFVVHVGVDKFLVVSKFILSKINE